MDPVSWLENVADGSPFVLLFVVMLALFVDSLAVIGALLPGDLLLLIPSAAVGPSLSLVVITGGVIGTVLGYLVSFMVGRWAGPSIRRSWLGRRVGDRRWMQAERLLRGPAGRTLALVQFMPVLNYLIPLLAGTLKVPLKRFVQLTSIGAVVYSSFYVSLGALAGGTGAAIGDSTGRLVGLLVVAVVVAAMGFTVLARAVHRMAEEEPDPAEQLGAQQLGTEQLGAEPGDAKPGDAKPVDAEQRNVADSAPCSAATAFSTGAGSRCP